MVPSKPALFVTYREKKKFYITSYNSNKEIRFYDFMKIFLG